MKTLATLTVILLGVLSFANDDIEVYVDTPRQIPHELEPLKPIPPLGTKQCEQNYVCDKNGNNCKWIVVCK